MAIIKKTNRKVSIISYKVTISLTGGIFFFFRAFSVIKFSRTYSSFRKRKPNVTTEVMRERLLRATKVCSEKKTSLLTFLRATIHDIKELLRAFIRINPKLNMQQLRRQANTPIFATVTFVTE